MKRFFNCIGILVGLGVLVCGILYFTHHCPASQPKVVSYRDTVWKTVIRRDTVQQQVLQPIESVPPAPSLLDSFTTAKDIKDLSAEFLTRNYYATNYSDSLLEIQVEDTVFQNRLLWQQVHYRFKNPLNTTPPALSRYQLHGGLEISYPFTTAVGLLLTDKHRRQCGISYSTANTITIKYYQPIFQF